MKRILAAALVLAHVAAAAAQTAPDTVLMQNNLNPVRSGQVLVTPTGGSQAKLSDALPPAGTCTIFVTTGPTRGPGNSYTASGAIAPSDFISYLDGASALAMTLGAGLQNGHPITISGGSPTYTSTSQVTLNLNGTLQTISIAPTTVENLVWNAGLATWNQC